MKRRRHIDTVTEQLLDEILSKLPASTTKVIIAHRLNTINNADEIYFVNSGEIIGCWIDGARSGYASAWKEGKLRK